MTEINENRTSVINWLQYGLVGIKTTLGTVVYAVLSKWYLMIAIPSMWITYIVFNELKTTGIMDRVQTVISRSLDDVAKVAVNCTKKIGDIGSFISCLDNPGANFGDYEYPKAESQNALPTSPKIKKPPTKNNEL